MSKAKVVGAAFAAFLSLAGVKKAEATPTVEGFNATTTEMPTRYQKMAAELEAARPDIDVLFIDYDVYEGIDLPAGLRGEVNYFVLEREKIAADLIKLIPEGARFPELPPDATRKGFIQYLSEHFVEVGGMSLSSAHAITTQIELPDGRKSHICMASAPNQMTADEFIQDFIGARIHAADIKVETIYDAIVDHELAHCMTPDLLRNSLPVAEGLADVYAVARHIQKHGFDDGFAENMRHLRRVSMVAGNDGAHYIAPLLDVTIPQIRAAYQKGELDHMTPAELLDQSTTWAFGRTSQERVKRMQAYHEEAKRHNAALTEIHEHADVDKDSGIMMLKKPVNEFSTAALVTLSRYQQSLEAIKGHMQPLNIDAQQRYEQQLADLLATKPEAEDRLRAIMLRDAEVQKRVHILAEEHKADPAALYHAMTSTGDDGISLVQVQEVIGNVRQHVAGEVNAALLARMESEVSGIDIQVAQVDLAR